MTSLIISIPVTFFETSSVNADDLASGLERNVANAIGLGLLQADDSVAVDTYDIKVQAVEQTPTQQDVADYWQQRIQDGNLSLDEVPEQLARLGALSPQDFADEMRERMGLDG